MNSRYAPTILAIFLGTLSFFLVAGLDFLNPKNISWIYGADPEQQYIGWIFFRNSPWTFPVGLNPNFGIDISSSIVYTDSIPLMALIFKLFNSTLPINFQYFGIWVLISFILQTWLGVKLIGLISSSLIIRLLGAGILLFAPTMLVRIGFHNNVAGHFQILAALYLTLRASQSHRIFLWNLVITTSLLVNFYIFIIVLVIWFSNLVEKFLVIRSLDAFSTLKEISCTLLLILFFGWQSGYFEVGQSISAGVYGVSRMNLLSIIDTKGWSYILQTISPLFESYEGFSYLGLGILVGALLCTAPLFSSAKIISQIKTNLLHFPIIILCLLGCALFAITLHVSIGSWEMQIPGPSWLLYIGSILRESTRLFWPVIYIISFLIIYIILRSYSHRTAVILISFILIVQIIDTSAGWLPIKEKIAKANQQSDIFSQHRTFFSDPFWANAAAHYHQLLIVPPQQPPGQIPYNWERYASFAMAHGMSTNSVYLARIDNRRLAAFNQNFEIAIAQGKYNSAAIYIVGDEMILPILMHLDSSTDLLARVNGLNVLAPGWKVCPSCPQVPPAFEIRQVIPTTDKKEKLDFSTSGLAKHFLVGVGAWPIVGWGWSYPEAFGTWSEGYQVKLTIPLPKEPILGITLEMRALVSPNHPQQIAAIWVNGQFQKKIALTQGNGNQVAIPIAPTTPARDYVKIEFSLESRAKPKDLGLGDDIRELAIGLTRGWWW